MSVEKLIELLGSGKSQPADLFASSIRDFLVPYIAVQVLFGSEGVLFISSNNLIYRGSPAGVIPSHVNRHSRQEIGHVPVL